MAHLRLGGRAVALSPSTGLRGCTPPATTEARRNAAQAAGCRQRPHPQEGIEAWNVELAHPRTRAKLRVSQHRPARGKMTTLTQLLERARAEIEIDAHAAERAVERGASLLDVQEPSETDDGHIPGATLVPRGSSSFASRASLDEATIVVCCASGTAPRRLDAPSPRLPARRLPARRLRRLEARRSASSRHRLLSDAARHFSRHVRIPEVGDAGQQRLLTSKALIVGAGGLGSGRLLPRGGGRRNAQHRRARRRRSLQPPAPDPARRPSRRDAEGGLRPRDT